MKLTELVNLTEQLKPGYTQGDPHVHSGLQLTVDQFKVSYQIHQETVDSPTRYYRDSPPESETYLGDAATIVIDSLTYLPLKYDLPDLEFETHYSELDDTATMQKFFNLLIGYGNALDNDETVEYNQKILPAIKQDPTFVKQIFAGIKKECEYLQKGQL